MMLEITLTFAYGCCFTKMSAQKYDFKINVSIRCMEWIPHVLFKLSALYYYLQQQALWQRKPSRLLVWSLGTCSLCQVRSIRKNFMKIGLCVFLIMLPTDRQKTNKQTNKDENNLRSSVEMIMVCLLVLYNMTWLNMTLSPLLYVPNITLQLCSLWIRFQPIPIWKGDLCCWSTTIWSGKELGS